MNFNNLRQIDSGHESRAYSFTLSPLHVSYANTLRRLILTGVETVAFRSDMTSTGSTTDVIVKHNDTAMTNEMLADRIGLIPINIKEPLKWKDDKYLFTLKVTCNKDNITYVKSSNFTIRENIPSDTEEPRIIPTDQFFPPNPITGDTCLIATLQPSSGTTPQYIEIEAKASKGTGREHARFSSVSQCSYEYTPDENPQRIEEMFQNWLNVDKKAGKIQKGSDRYNELRREFNTMQIKRCFKVNEKNEPYSFDFVVESAGVLPVYYIVERACEVGENMCSRYVNINLNDLPPEVTISSADSRIIGFDFVFRGHDHTLGNLLQTWLVENHIQGKAVPKITFAGYSVPHPLRDEMVLRIGVEDGEEATARLAVANAAKGCVELFQQLRNAWRVATGSSTVPSATPLIRQKPRRKVTPKIG
jgi:DNA-directed RNA polymerase subunit L